jgi:hypothetical protein
MEDAQRHLSNLRNAIPGLMGYVEHQKSFAKKHKCVYTAFGRRLPIPTIDSQIMSIRRKGERRAIDYTIQGTSADILKFAMCFVDKNIRAMGWEDKVRYVLTVHDEVVFEIRPEILQEAVRKLDEWMTKPWSLTKPHGKQWIVPLVTEPGIDIHWRARYDYFKMVDGTPVKPIEINEDGSYKGKIKKDEYFHNGKIYQKIPDFLEKWIHRLDETPKEGDVEVGESISSEISRENTLTPDDVNYLLNSKHDAIPVNEEDHTKVVVNNIVNVVNEVAQVLAEVAEEIELPSIPNIPEIKSDHPKIEESKQLNEVSSIDDTVSVFRWIIGSNYSEYTMRKLHAICILTEGPTPLRVVNKNGDILVGENEGIKVEPKEFSVLTKLFLNSQ